MSHTATSTLNALLQGELSAVQSYEQALALFGSTKGVHDLQRLDAEHRAAVDNLRQQIRYHGGKPALEPPRWTLFPPVDPATGLLGDEALQALKEGEQHGIEQYEEALQKGDLPADAESFISSTLLPRTREHISVLNRLIAGRVERIAPEQARADLQDNPHALLVCAYQSPEAWREERLHRSIPLAELQRNCRSLPHNTEIIFYCRCPHEETSARIAEQFQEQGFTNVKVLLGGVDGWRATNS